MSVEESVTKSESLIESENDNKSEAIDIKDSVELDETRRIILMPVDFSENSERAFNWFAKKEFHKENDILFLVHVIESVTNQVSYDSTSKIGIHTNEFNKMLQGQINDGKKVGHKFLEICKEKSISAKFTVHIGAKPGEHIVKLTKEHKINTIVIGNRKISGLRRTILGSVSEYILKHVSCPVIVVPPKKDKKDQLQSSDKDSIDKDKKKSKLSGFLSKKSK